MRAPSVIARACAPPRRRVGSLALALVLCCASRAFAGAFDTRVVAVAADRVYVGAGRADGVVRGARVTVRARTGTFFAAVDAVSEHSAAFPLDVTAAHVAVGDEATVEQQGSTVDWRAADAGPEVGPRAPAADLYRSFVAITGEPPPLVVAGVDRGRAAMNGGARDGTHWHGNVGLSGEVVHDFSSNGLDFYQARLDSRLQGDDLLGGHFRYDHRLAVQGEFGPGLDSRPGYAVQRWVRAEWLRLTYLPVAHGPWEISAGRMLPLGYGLLGPTDGARMGWEGRHAGVSITAGLPVSPTDTMPTLRGMRASLDGHLTGRAASIDYRADLGLNAGMTDGLADRAALTLALQARRHRFFDLFGYGEIGWLPSDLRADGASAITLDRLHAFLSLHPHRILDIDLRYSLDRPVADRLLRSLLPAAYLVDDLRQTGALAVRLRLGGRVIFEPRGEVDYSDSEGLRWGAGARLDLDRFPLRGSRLGLQGHFSRGVAVDTATAGLRLSQQVSDRLDVWGGYAFTFVDERPLLESYLIHHADAGGQWMLARSLAASLEASWDHGAFEEVLAGFGRLVFWF